MIARRLPCMLLLVALASCSRFGEAIVGGDAAVDVTLVDRLDAPDAAPDIARVDASCAAPCTDPLRPTCDPALGLCVGCTASPDSCPVDRYCDPELRVCRDGCRVDDDCNGARTSRPGAVGRFCDAARRACVDCRRDGDCPAGLLCADGACTSGCGASRSCAPGESCCGGACVDTARSLSHCGRCGSPCALPGATSACRDGACVVGGCTPGHADCDGITLNGCERSLEALASCGACGLVCPSRDNADATCGASMRCGFTCRAGFADCDRAVDDGCEADLASDPAHCGACGQACAVDHGAAGCAAGRCVVRACSGPWADCDRDPSDGCETDLSRSTASCGACGRACPERPNAGAMCFEGICRFQCTAGWADCDGRADNGCEADLVSDPAHCGGCATSCNVANGDGRCVAGVCSVARCDAGNADCNGDLRDGCETVTASDPRNCGGCGRACGGGQVCAAGVCQAVCTSPQVRCGDACADVTSDEGNCGGCGRACAVGLTCAAGACRLECRRAGESACGGRCVAYGADPLNCGGCGVACATPGNARATCATSACGFACLPGFGDCDGASGNGCEASLGSDVVNCGACRAPCATPHATPACVGGRCVVSSCAMSWGDCDGDATNGCELDLRADDANCGRCGQRCGAGTRCASGVCVAR